MFKKFLIGTSCIAAAIVATSANAFEFGKPVEAQAVVTKQGQNFDGSSTGTKKVYLMKINLGQKEFQQLVNYKPKHNLNTFAGSGMPSATDVGMNGVPVLNQGWHGTCATFAVSAVLDAIIGQGDHISALCSLELGRELETKGYFPSGWDGAWTTEVVEQMLRFGVVSMDTQKTKGCAGVYDYPTLEEKNIGEPMTLSQYKPLSENLSEKVVPAYHLNFFQRFLDPENDTLINDAFKKVKDGLNKGHRFTVGTIVITNSHEVCPVGICASHKAKNDTWAHTQDIAYPTQDDIAGHMMVITGYDDNATATDRQGRKHKGLIIMRNSWGDNVGDGGTFYMTYDYFKRYVGDVTEYMPLPQQQQG